MPNCEQHPTDIPGWDGTLAELAEAVENMRYDKTAEFLWYLSQSFKDRSKRDRLAGRNKLANALYNAYTRTEVVRTYVSDAWSICKPYMRLDDVPSRDS